MKKEKSRKKALILLVLILIQISVFSANEYVLGVENMTTVTPTESNEPFFNPDMGWVYIVNQVRAFNGSQPVEDLGRKGTFPLVNNVAILSAWGALEPSEGVFDWSKIDAAIQYWGAQQNKRIHFRISTDTMLLSGFSKEPSGSEKWQMGVPEWLYTNYGVPYMQRQDQGMTFFVADYTHPIYMTKLSNFLTAFANKYKDNPYIDVVNLLGYGEWGEWHSGHNFANLSQRISTLKTIIDKWYSAWEEKKTLALSCSYEWRTDMFPDVDNPPTYSKYKQWSAFDYALTKPKITFMRNGIAGAIKQYDRQFLLDFFNSNRNLPIVGEFFGLYDGYKNYNLGGYTPETALDEALTLHPNYLTIMGHDAECTAPEFYAERQDLIANGLNNMGYRFLLKSASYPSQINVGQRFILNQEWVNKAVGRSIKKQQLKLYLTDSQGNTLWSGSDVSFDLRGLTKGNTYTKSSEFLLDKELSSGNYTLRLSVLDDSFGNINLAMTNKDSEGRYILGNIKINNPSPLSGKLVKENGDYKLSLSGVSETKSYQIWVKDAEITNSNEQWHLAKGFSDNFTNGYNLSYTPIKNSNGYCSFFVRVKSKETNTIVDSQYFQFNNKDTNTILVHSAYINGNIFQEDKFYSALQTPTITIKAIADGITSSYIRYNFLYSNSVSSQSFTNIESGNTTGECILSLSGLLNTEYVIKIVAYDVNNASTNFDVYYLPLKINELQSQNQLTGVIANPISSDGNLSITANTINSTNDGFVFTFAEPNRLENSISKASNSHSFHFEGYGIYEVGVALKDSFGRIADQNKQLYSYARPNNAIKMDIISSKGNKVNKGELIELNVNANWINDAPCGILYSFWKQDKNGFSLIKDWSSDATLSTKFEFTGNYTLQVRAKGSTLASSFEALKDISFEVVDNEYLNSNISILDISPSSQTLNINKEVTLSANVTSNNNELLLYKFEIYKKGQGSSLLRDYSPSEKVSFTPNKQGKYSVIVKVKSIFSGGVYDKMIIKEFEIQ